MIRDRNRAKKMRGKENVRKGKNKLEEKLKRESRGGKNENKRQNSVTKPLIHLIINLKPEQHN